jgi:O-antigen/teichoic acid export membrane protein
MNIGSLINLLALVRGRGGLSESETRLRKAAFSSLGQAVSKGANILVTIISVPLIIGYLGSAYYGVAMAISGFANWFLFDTGIAEGVKVRLIETFAREDRRAAQTYVSTGFFVLLLLFAVIAAGFYASFPFIDWGAVFNVAAGQSHLHAAILLTVSMMLIMIPLKIVREIYTADQRGFVFFLWRTAATVLSLGVIWLVIKTDLGIPGVLAALLGPIVLVTFVSSLFLFIKDMPWLMPRISYISMTAWKNMWVASFGLFMFGIARMAINGADVFIVNLFKGGDDASVYGLSLRLLLYIEVIVSFLLYPAWPAIGDAIQKGRKRWVRKASIIMSLLSFGFAVPMCVLLVVFGKPIIKVWSGGEVDASMPLMLLLGVYLILRIWCDVFGTLLRALGQVNYLGLATFIEAVLHIGIGIILMQRMGLIGFAIGSVGSIALTRCWILPLECYFSFRRHSWENIASLDKLDL